MTLWITDDRNKVPVLGKSMVIVGSVKLELVKIEGQLYFPTVVDSEITAYKNRDSGIIDRIEISGLEDGDHYIFNGYNYTLADNTSNQVPTKIEVYKVNPDNGLRELIVLYDIYLNKSK